MKITAKQIVNADPALRQLLMAGLDAPAGWWVARQARTLIPEIELLEKARNGLITKLGKPEVEGGPAVIKPNTPEMEAFQREWDELLTQEVELDLQQKPISFLGHVTLPAAVLLDLDFLFTDG